MLRKYLKPLIYLSIIALPLLAVMFKAPSLKLLSNPQAVSGPLAFLAVPINELKKIVLYHAIYDEYKVLKRQNDLLRQRMASMNEAQFASKRQDDIEYYRRQSAFVSVVADVIGRDPSNWNASLIINRGIDDGLKPGMPVVSTLGVVGRIYEVGQSTAKVILLSDPNFNVAALISRSRESGLLTGSLQGLCRLQYLTNGADVKVGDDVVTSKLSSVFPEGLLIGRVVDVQAGISQYTVECLVEPAVELSRLEEVIVIKH